MNLVKWTIILAAAAIVLAVVGFVGLIAGAVAGVAKFMFFVTLAGAVICFVLFLHSRRLGGRGVEPLGPTRLYEDRETPPVR